ncbi:hypothetical protein Tco_1422592 [Tanacetum coccineum]
MEDDVDIIALTMEQYIALIPDDIKLGILNPKIGDDVEFEINAYFMRQLRCKLYVSTDDEEAYEHGISNYTQGTGLEMEKQASTRDNHYMVFFTNVLLYQCPSHDLNCQRKVHIFYTGLDISTRKILYSNEFIPLMTPTQALESIQVMADHSHEWYDERTTRERINDVLDNSDAIHESFKEEHTTKQHPLKKEDKAIKHSRYMESLE